MFGWDLPPGVTNKMIDDAFGREPEPMWVAHTKTKKAELQADPEDRKDAIAEAISIFGQDVHFIELVDRETGDVLDDEPTIWDDEIYPEPDDDYYQRVLERQAGV